MLDIRNFTKGATPDAIARLNKMAEVVRQTKQVTSDSFVSVRQSPAQATSHGLNLNLLRQRLGRAGSKIRRARTTAAAGAAATIICNLLDSNDVEITSGDEFNVTVYCDICGGNSLNAASPLLADDDYIDVFKHNDKWRCPTTFQAFEICICTQA